MATENTILVKDLDDPDNAGGTYYSILPDRRVAVKERWKHWWRRTVFYIMILLFTGGITVWGLLVADINIWFWLLHTLWFELDVTVSKNNIS